MKPKIYITRKIPDSTLQKLKEHCHVTMWEEEETPVPRDVLKEQLKTVDGLYCLLTEQIDSELLKEAAQLKVISNMAVGFNNIDVEAASEKGIMVTNTPGVLTESTADLAFALLMATARRIPESSEFLRTGKWKAWAPMMLTGQDVFGATLGIVGMGRIGEGVARRAKGFDMEVLYHNRSRKPDVESQLGVTYVELEELLKQSDYVMILVPFSEETKNLISEKELSLMKETSILINVARGGIVNEHDLYHALKDQKIWAAGLDVFEQEPVSLNHPLLSLPNVVVLPHIGSASIKTRIKMSELAAENLLQALAGNTPQHLVNKELL
ncbi:glyoxylate reductase [Bacillus mesophilus]|uniref:D-glycerate dehydrogenase n=1 Tax=Bacillus mesophilus TaxID=1808955 RepID=A0A6M0Q905_9BACI|nr:glyoxylate reductase [Bacillus mesophilus]NEY72866.1 D-glycerate dehydrogenase [Bacillus mesophilus]